MKSDVHDLYTLLQGRTKEWSYTAICTGAHAAKHISVNICYFLLESSYNMIYASFYMLHTGPLK